MTTAYEKVKQQYLTEDEVARILNVDTKRIQDLRSYHVTGKLKFIDHIKPTARCPLYKVEDVLFFLNEQPKFSFGISNSSLDK